VLDSDFSTSTTLFSDSAGRKLITSINKNGYAYTFDRTNLSDGPLWRQYIAEGGECPTCGESSVSSGAFGQGTLYLAGATGTIGDSAYPGTVRALNPDTGAYLWSHATSGTVIGALAYANGVVYSGGGSVFEALDASTGKRLYSYDTGAQIYAGASIANGMAYVGNVNGDVVAFKVGIPVTPPADPTCPTGFTCADVGSPTPAGSDSVAGGVLTLNAGGAGLAGTGDAFRIAAKPAGGDVQVSARVSGLTGGTSATGVIVRQSLEPGSPYYAVLAKPGNTLAVQQRSVHGGRPARWSPSPGPRSRCISRCAASVTRCRPRRPRTARRTRWFPARTRPFRCPTPATQVSRRPLARRDLGDRHPVDDHAGAADRDADPPPPATACPSGWSCQDVGNPNLAGDQSLSARRGR